MNGFRTTPDLSSFGIERLGLSYNEFCGRSPLRDDIWYWQVPSIRACRNQSEDAVVTRAIPRRSVLNVQMLRLWDDRLHFVISPVIIVSGPLSPLFQLTTATSVTSTRAPSLSRFLASPSERHTDTDHHGPSWLAVGPTGPSSVRSKIIPPHLLPGIIVACKTNGIGAAGAASLSGVLGR